MATVGFGDLVPFTVPGKAICMVNAFIGTFFISLMVVTLAGVIELNSDEKKAFHNLLEQEQAARTIEAALRLRVTTLKKNKLR